MQDANFTFDSKNYEGAVFASELARKLNLAVVGFVPLPVMICTYDVSNNILTISMTDARTEANILPIRLQILTDDTLTLGPPRASSPNTINTIIRNTNQPVITVAESYKCYPDFFQTRNLYLTSSALASYDTVSNFGLDTIIKKIPCTAGYNKLLTQSSGSTLDGLDVSKRTLRVIDFKLVDSSYRTVPLQGNHFSFSIIFTQKH